MEMRVNQTVPQLTSLITDAAIGVDEMAKAITQLDKPTEIQDLVRQYAGIKAAEDAMEEAKKTLTAIKAHWQYTILPEALREKGIKTTTVIGVGRVSLSTRWSASMLDKEKGMQWLKDNDHGDLIQPTVNASTLSAFAKNLMEESGKELPDDIFKVGLLTGVSLTKA